MIGFEIDEIGIGSKVFDAEDGQVQVLDEAGKDVCMVLGHEVADDGGGFLLVHSYGNKETEETGCPVPSVCS